MDRNNGDEKRSDEPEADLEHETTPELEGISPLNPSTFPRAEDDEGTFAHSPEFHDLPDPGPNVGRGNRDTGGPRKLR
jgi:hypothetical protein